jgi:methylmalonyl-CoA mutase
LAAWRAIEAGIPKRIEEAAAKTQARIDAGQQSVIGVNSTARPTKRRSMLKVDNSAVLRLQIDKLARLRRERNEADVKAALRSATRTAGAATAICWRLQSMPRARKRLWVKLGGSGAGIRRHRARSRRSRGVQAEVGMSDAVVRVQKLVAEFEANEGRRPRILVAKIGQDGHDRGQKVIASAFADIGFDVDVGPLFATAAEAARQAIENDVHILGVSTLAAAHLTAVPELKAELEKQGRPDIMIVVGGVVPPQDYDTLYTAGAEAIFPPGTVIAEAADELIHKLNRRLGHASEAAE